VAARAAIRRRGHLDLRGGHPRARAPPDADVQPVRTLPRPPRRVAPDLRRRALRRAPRRRPARHDHHRAQRAQPRRDRRARPRRARHAHRRPVRRSQGGGCREGGVARGLHVPLGLALVRVGVPARRRRHARDAARGRRLGAFADDAVARDLRQVRRAARAHARAPHLGGQLARLHPRLCAHARQHRLQLRGPVLPQADPRRDRAPEPGEPEPRVRVCAPHARVQRRQGGGGRPAPVVRPPRGLPHAQRAHGHHLRQGAQAQGLFRHRRRGQGRQGRQGRRQEEEGQEGGGPGRRGRRQDRQPHVRGREPVRRPWVAWMYAC
jgi:hypothetical protein